MAKEKSAAIIGAGLGGLSAAIHLANAGYSVDVFEKNSFPGGKAGCLASSGFRFDTGPSLLTLPFVLESIFNSSGEKISDYLHIERLNIICRYFYKDKTIINAYKDPEKFGREINEKTHQSPALLYEYLKYCKSIYDLTADLFLFSSFRNFSGMFNRKAFNTLINIGKIDPFRTMNKSIESFFTDKRIVQLFNRYATYNGSNPYKAPATLNIIAHVEYNIGGYIVKEGMYAVPKALEILASKRGVRFFYNTEITRIAVDNSRVQGIFAGDKKLDYFHIVSNADVNYTYKYLMNSKVPGDNKIEPSSSAFIFYWGVKGSYPQLEIHNILFSDDYKAEFNNIFNDKIIPDDFTVYIYISSRFIPSDAPEDHENWFVMINTPNTSGNNIDYNVDKIRSGIVKKIKEYTGIDIIDKIIFEKYVTPDDIESNTNSYWGSIYGLSSNNRRAAFLRHKNKSKLKGLYFAGGSVHPGGGIPLVLLSGKLAAESIIRGEI